MTQPRVTVSFCALVVAFAAIFPAGIFAQDPEPDDYKVLKEIIVQEFSKEVPHERGPLVPGVRTRLKTQDKVVALTLEATGRGGNGIDGEVLSVLEKENIPATLFVSGEWLDKNPDAAKRLAGNPRFEIANLGLEAKSCSVDGKFPAGASSTRSVEEVFAEIEKNARKIEKLTGVLPRFFRSGPAYYDDVAVRIAKALGYEVVGASVPGGERAGRMRQRVFDVMLQASAGSIAAISLDLAGAEAAAGMKQAIVKLRSKGFRFVKLGDYPFE